MSELATRHYWVIKMQRGRWIGSTDDSFLISETLHDAMQYTTQLSANRALKRCRKRFPTQFKGGEKPELIKPEGAS